jgi:hypothetical protein
MQSYYKRARNMKRASIFFTTSASKLRDLSQSYNESSAEASGSFKTTDFAAKRVATKSDMNSF